MSQRSTPTKGTPTRATPTRATPTRSTASKGTPIRGTPTRGTPTRGTPAKSPSSQDTVYFLAGENEIPVRAPRAVLSNSPILRDWLQDPSQVPQSLKNRGRIHFRGCEPAILRAVLHLLGTATFGIDEKAVVRRWADCVLTGTEDAKFLLKMYKFAKSIKADSASSEAIKRLRARTVGVEEFVDATIIIGKLDIVEDKKISSWVSSWLAHNMDKATASGPAQNWLQKGSPETWTFTTTLMQTIVQLQEKVERLGGEEETEDEHEWK